MAITRHLARLLLREHRHRPISGSGLLLARQTVFLTPDQAMAMVESEGIALRPERRVEVDRFTPRGKALGYISDESFFSLFSDARFEILDVTSARGTTIVQDLCAQLPDALADRFDFIYNGSVLDNVFDAAGAMDNVTRMLRPSGVAFHYEGGRHFGMAYVQFSPDWFFDYAAVNNYDDCKVYYCTHDDIHNSDWDVYFWTPYHEAADRKFQLTPRMRHAGDSVVVCITQRSAETTFGRRPIQSNYRPDHRIYIERALHFVNRGRKVTATPLKDWPGHWYVGRI